MVVFEPGGFLRRGLNGAMEDAYNGEKIGHVFGGETRKALMDPQPRFDYSAEVFGMAKLST